MKSNKKQKGKYAGSINPKPYTVKQENDIFLGKVLFWILIVFYPTIGFFAWVMSWNIGVCLLIWGIFSLFFAIYHLMGLIFKWDHARVCTRRFLKKRYKFDIRNAWSKEDTKNSIGEIALFSIFAVLFLIGSICHF